MYIHIKANMYCMYILFKEQSRKHQGTLFIITLSYIINEADIQAPVSLPGHCCVLGELKVVESRISSYCGTFSIAATDPPTRTWNEGGIACKCTTYECQAFSNMKKLQ